jgi:hypothetical protein
MTKVTKTGRTTTSTRTEWWPTSIAIVIARNCAACHSVFYKVDRQTQQSSHGCNCTRSWLHGNIIASDRNNQNVVARNIVSQEFILRPKSIRSLIYSCCFHWDNETKVRILVGMDGSKGPSLNWVECLTCSVNGSCFFAFAIFVSIIWQIV